MPRSRHARRGAPLDAEIQRGDAELDRAVGRDDVRLRGRDRRSEVGAEHALAGPYPIEQPVRRLERRDPAAHRTALAQVAGERPGVDAADADDALGVQLLVEAARRAPGARPAGRVAHDVAGNPHPAALRVLVVDAGVADVRGGLHHDLARVARVGQRFLVAGHARREDRFAEGLPRRAIGVAGEAAAVFEHEHRARLAGGHCCLPIRVDLEIVEPVIVERRVMRPCRPAPWPGRAGTSRRPWPGSPFRRKGYCGCATPDPPGRRPMTSPGRPA